MEIKNNILENYKKIWVLLEHKKELIIFYKNLHLIMKHKYLINIILEHIILHQQLFVTI